MFAALELDAVIETDDQEVYYHSTTFTVLSDAEKEYQEPVKDAKLQYYLGDETGSWYYGEYQETLIDDGSYDDWYYYSQLGHNPDEALQDNYEDAHREIDIWVFALGVFFIAAWFYIQRRKAWVANESNAVARGTAVAGLGSAPRASGYPSIIVAVPELPGDLCKIEANMKELEAPYSCAAQSTVYRINPNKLQKSGKCASL